MGQDEAAARHALFETLHWAVTIDDRLQKYWQPQKKSLGQAWRGWWGEAGAMQGARGARHRVHND